MTSPTLPKPTIGRKVWYWGRSTVGVNDKLQPFDATIVFVHSPSMVNLRVTDHAGNARTAASVQLRAPDPQRDQHGPDMAFATWMPYQLREEAKRHPAQVFDSDTAT